MMVRRRISGKIFYRLRQYIDVGVHPRGDNIRLLFNDIEQFREIRDKGNGEVPAGQWVRVLVYDPFTDRCGPKQAETVEPTVSERLGGAE